ncbi:hypothetical protein TNCV_4551901 [Trichonephila clavipes]|nr:hypothetical protein TNCV_4551901 [Trichonephila clavipes]
MNGGHGQWKGMTLSLLTNPSSAWNSTMVGFVFGDTKRLLNCCFMYRLTGLAPGTMVWGGIGFHFRALLVRIAGILNSQRCISEVLKLVVLRYI